MEIQYYKTIDGKSIGIDKSKVYRMPNASAEGISYPVIGNLDRFMSLFQEKELKNRTVETAQVAMKYFESYIYPRAKNSKALFVAVHSTALFSPSDGPVKLMELDKIHDELMNTYNLLEQIVEK